MSTDQIKARIRKCLNLANDDGAMDGEIANAMRFARRLMLQHNLSEDEVMAGDSPTDPHEVAAVAEATEYARQKTWTTSGRLTTWEVYLLNAIEELVGTVKFYRQPPQEKRTTAGTMEFDAKGKPKKAVPITFYGPAEDVADATTIFDEWAETIVALARMRYGGAFRGEGRSYCEGFARALSIKATEMRREEEAQVERLAVGSDLDVQRLGNGTDDERALILRDRPEALALSNAHALMLAKQEKAEDWLKESEGVKLRKSGGSGFGLGNHYGGAYSQGKTDGRRSSFTHQRKPKLGGG